jgi:hypothetical protein
VKGDLRLGGTRHPSHVVSAVQGRLACCCSWSVCWRGAQDRTSCRRPTSMCRPRRIPLPTSPRHCARTPWNVLYATDRQPVSRDDGGLAYGYGRSFSIAVGSCVVEIGQNVAWDTLVAQSRQAERTEELPLHIRTLTEQARFPATPMPFVLHHGQPTVAPAVQARLLSSHGPASVQRTTPCWAPRDDHRRPTVLPLFSSRPVFIGMLGQKCTATFLLRFQSTSYARRLRC